jgi:hypothetical protein
MAKAILISSCVHEMGMAMRMKVPEMEKQLVLMVKLKPILMKMVTPMRKD